MSDKVGTLALGTENEEIFLGRDISRNKKHSDKTAEIIDEEIKNIIAAAKERSEKILKDNIEKLKYMVEMLIEREFLTGDEVDAIMKGEKLQAKEEIQENKTETQQEKEEVKPVEETRSSDKKEIKEEPKIIAEEVKPDKKTKKNKQDSSQNELFDKIGKENKE